MRTAIYRERLKKLESILQDSVFLLSNSEFPVYNFNHEVYPDEIPLVFQPAKIPTFPDKQTILDPQGEILAVDNYLNRNFACKLCPDRDRGIRGFLIRGRKKLLILHYSGNTGNATSFIKKSNKTIFRTKDIESCFEELTEKFCNTSYQEYFFQEYPACHFSKEMDTKSWERRTTHCDNHILETVKKEGIKAILVLGSSAVLRWTPEFCKTNQGKIMAWTFSDGTKLPFAITRSPDALHHAKINSPEKYPSILNEMGGVLKNLSQTVGGLD
ncbi:MAG: hypothetical protein JJT78_01170 [Leptospira sp.]|nr:hypothetical protein [Leptospira sp.]